MNRSRLQRIAARLFLSAGYLTGALGWLWALLVTVPSLIKSGALDSLMATSAPAEPVVATSPIETSPLAWVIIGAVTLVILAITVIILIRIPRTIVHSGEQLVNHTAKVVVPVIAHHKPLPAKRQRMLSRRVVLGLQLILSVVPLLISPFLPPYDELTTQIIMTVAACLTVAATVSFALAWLIEPKRPTSRTRSRASRG
jgi:hypothetical protein